MGTQENKSIVERFDRLISACELEALDQICTPGMINHSLASGRPPGLAGTKEWLAETERDPGLATWRRSMHLDQQLVVVAEGDRVIQFGSRASTWPGGTFRGIGVPAGDYECEVAFMYRLDAGRIAERWALRDDLGMILHLTTASPQSAVEGAAR